VLIIGKLIAVAQIIKKSRLTFSPFARMLSARSGREAWKHASGHRRRAADPLSNLAVVNLTLC
jgi:uncharacterized protein YktB (UPF0637 family)